MPGLWWCGRAAAGGGGRGDLLAAQEVITHAQRLELVVDGAHRPRVVVVGGRRRRVQQLAVVEQERGLAALLARAVFLYRA